MVVDDIEYLAQTFLQHKGKILGPHRDEYLVLAPDINRHIYRMLRGIRYTRSVGRWVAEWLHKQRNTLILKWTDGFRVNNLCA